MRNEDDFTNWNAADAEYLNGKARDKATGVSGTRWNEALYGDLLQATLKAVRDSGTVVNHDEDNETNGYQLFEALRIALGKKNFVRKDYTAGDTSYTVEKGVNIVLTRNYASGGVQVILPSGSEWVGSEILIVHEIGNAGAIELSDITNLNQYPSAAGSFVDWIKVFHDGTNWISLDWARNA